MKGQGQLGGRGEGERGEIIWQLTCLVAPFWYDTKFMVPLVIAVADI